MIKNMRFLPMILLGLFIGISAPKLEAEAAPTDEIQSYDITAEVNDDATVTLTYDFSWKVLESDTLGPVTWLEIGVPNSNCDNVTALTDNIKSAEYNYDSGYYVRVDFKDSYYEGQVIDFSFSVDQDCIYQMNKYEDGYTVYSFTPGWFNEDTLIDDVTIRWNCDNVTSWNPDGKIENGFVTWDVPADDLEDYEVEITYPNDAYEFTEYEEDDDEISGVEDVIIAILAGIITLGILAGPIIAIIVVCKVVSKCFNNGSGFQSSTIKKTTRTKVEYYPSCPGCGAVREEGQETCPYCGRSFIKSKETITEDQIPEEEKALKNKTRNGSYKYVNTPNTYLFVNTVHVPRPKPPVSHSSTRSSGGSSHRSSCAHSSCACASHCACACACACAGGGRAGCSTKDFYNTKLKLKYIERLDRKSHR